MNIVAWIIFGISVGILANTIDRKPAYGGIVGAVFLGILGAIIGGLIGTAFLSGGLMSLNFYTILIAVVGSLIFLRGAKSIRKT